MKPKTWLIRLLGLTLAALVSTAMAQNDPHWEPEKASRIPFTALDAALDDAQSVIYLNSACKVMAVLVPEPSVINKYVPTARKINVNWMDRREFTSLTCTSSPTFLDTTPVTGGANPNACKPGLLLTAGDLTNQTCEITPANVAALIVLNPAHDPLVIMEGQSAQRFAQKQFPAIYLARTNFLPACSPAIPSPCLAPKQGVIKIVNGAQMCVCQ